jgi:hypothetical protein
MSTLGRMTLIVLLFGLSCAPADPDQADLVLQGGVVWTGVPGALPAEAIAVREGKILTVGTTEAVGGFTGPGTRVVELAGRMVLPGSTVIRISFPGVFSSRPSICGMRPTPRNSQGELGSLPAPSPLAHGSPVGTGTMRCGVGSFRDGNGSTR